MTFLYRFSQVFFFTWVRLLHSFRVYGSENFPRKGPFICAANHASIGDPPLVGLACKDVQLIYMAKEQLLRNKRWGWWFRGVNCIPISRNKRDFRATKQCLRRLKNGEAIVIFPEGTRSVTGELNEPELGVGFLSEKAGAPVIPVYIRNTREVWPKGGRYKPGIPISLYVGKALDLNGVEKIQNKRERYTAMSRKAMEAIARLKEKTERDDAGRTAGKIEK